LDEPDAALDDVDVALDDVDDVVLDGPDVVLDASVPSEPPSAGAGLLSDAQAASSRLKQGRALADTPRLIPTISWGPSGKISIDFISLLSNRLANRSGARRGRSASTVPSCDRRLASERGDNPRANQRPQTIAPRGSHQ
jgi:hypothetical protein